MKEGKKRVPRFNSKIESEESMKFCMQIFGCIAKGHKENVDSALQSRVAST